MLNLLNYNTIALSDSSTTLIRSINTAALSGSIQSANPMILFFNYNEYR